LSGDAGLVDWRLHGALSRLLIAGRIKGEFGSDLLMPANHLRASRIILMGLGSASTLDSEHLGRVLDEVREKLDGLKETRFAISLPGAKPGVDIPADISKALVDHLLSPLMEQTEATPSQDAPQVASTPPQAPQTPDKGPAQSAQTPDSQAAPAAPVTPRPLAPAQRPRWSGIDNVTIVAADDVADTVTQWARESTPWKIAEAETI
jgi:hypothetical protein